MTTIMLILKNLTRNRLRTLLTLMAIALPIFVFTVAHSFVDLVAEYLRESDRNMRVAVHQKLTYTVQLPQRIRGEIEALAPEGYLAGVCRASWFGGRVEDSQETFGSMAIDRDTFPLVYSEFEMSPEEIEQFQSERRGVVIGPSLANQMNWNVGDRLTLVGSLPPFPKIEFVVSAIPKSMDRAWLYFGLDYYTEIVEELGGRPVGVHNFWIKCNSDDARRWALTEIDQHFANSEYETRTEMESTFLAAFTRSGGDWVGMVWTVGQLIVLVAVAVAFNTMSMGFRERTREIAVMRALGFSGGWLMRLVLLEGALLGLLGGAVAVLPIYILSSLTELSIPSMNLSITISESTTLIAMGVALMCGLLAAVLPAALASRLQVAPALRKVV